ncbi:MAG TPA: hypothetical protein VNI57_07275, partial [Candidatus Saccharimonadales bacterium]|nr:hypothetical protein [Candidatus Saccharimonadales bacterium]
KTRTRLTFGTNTDFALGWTADGKQILVNDEATGILLVDAGGSGKTQTPGKGFSAATSRDGRWLTFTEPARTTSFDIWYVGLRDGGKPQIFLQTPALELWPQFSADGKLLAYQSNESGRTQVYIRPFPQGEGLWQASSDGGFWPRWNAAGNALYYIGGGTLWEVGVSREEGGVTLGAPRALFSRESFGENFILDWPADFDVAPDEKSFFIFEPVEPANPGRQAITVEENWALQAAAKPQA